VSIYRQHHVRALKSGTAWLPGAGALLRMLKEKGYKLAIASNRPTRFTHIILKHLKGDALFDHILCGDRVEKPKPAAEILEKTLAKFSLKPEAAVYVGDMTIDIETGRAAGVRTVAVATGSNTKEELAALRPAAVIDRISQLMDVLKGMG
jgi:phosphoglycolate phosphatase